MFLRSEKRSVPGDFEEAKRPTKMQRIGDIAPVVLVAAQSSSVPPKDANGHHVSAPRSAKRKLEQQDATSNSLPSKKIRLSANGDDFKRSLPGLRGGSTRRRRKVVGSDGEDGSSSPTRVTAAQSPEKNESEGEPTSSSPTSATEGSNSNNSSEPTSSSPKPIAKSEGDETQIEPTSSSTTAATDTESGEINNREPTSSSPQQDDSSATSADNTCEPAEEPKEPAVGPSDATDPKTTTSEGSATMNESEAQTSENPAIFETRLAKRPQRFVNGLLNNSNQCFANSTIQFFDAAVEGHDLDMVLGEVEEVQNPAFAEPMLTLDDDFTPPKKTRGKATKRPRSKLTKIKNGILRGIKKLRGSGDLKDISPRRHMRRLLHRMRQSKGKGRSNWVTPFVFQQILAYGDENADRELLDGMEQQDAYEYFQAVLAGMKGNSTDDVSDGEDDEKSAIIDHLFNFKSETATICTNEDCDHRAAVQGAVDNAHVVYVSGKRTSVTELLDESTVSELKSEKCPKCDTETLERRTEFKEVADNFVVHINRTDMSDGSKRKTAVELPLDPFELCGKEYVLNAVIRHKGDSAHAGHYTILRRRSPEWHTPVDGLWFLFNDDEISPVTKTQVQKDSCSGQSSLLLFKAL